MNLQIFGYLLDAVIICIRTPKTCLVGFFQKWGLTPKNAKQFFSLAYSLCLLTEKVFWY